MCEEIDDQSSVATGSADWQRGFQAGLEEMRRRATSANRLQDIANNLTPQVAGRFHRPLSRYGQLLRLKNELGSLAQDPITQQGQVPAFLEAERLIKKMLDEYVSGERP